MNRKNFLKSSCIAGTCLCGFGSALAISNNPSTHRNNGQNDEMTLLKNFSNKNNESLKKAIKNASMTHYDYLDMDNVLEPYRGKLENFVEFLKKNWDWKVQFEGEKNILLADENKSYCVCPLIQQGKENKAGILCNCSEGFAEKMFSTVIGHPVSARVASSVLRGDDSCVYEIDLNKK